MDEDQTTNEDSQETSTEGAAEQNVCTACEG